MKLSLADLSQTQPILLFEWQAIRIIVMLLINLSMRIRIP
jgi:hypothetical protein